MTGLRKFRTTFFPGLALAFFLLFVPFAASEAAESAEKLSVVATLFPQYDFARRIAGGRATVTMLLPPGTESHTFDPKPGDIRSLNRADIVIYTGDTMEPWAGRIFGSLDSKKVLVIDASAGIELREAYEHDEHSHNGHAHEEHEYDPHIWLDLSLAAKMVDGIEKGFCERDPGNAEFYARNASALRADLRHLDEDFRAAIAQGRRDTLVFGGRFAYMYFLEHYGLKYVTAYDGCSTEGEPGVRRIAEVIRFMAANGVKYIFHEEFADPRVARSIAEQAKAELLLFSTAHNVTKDEFESGVTFIEIMRGNLRNVEAALR